MVNITVYEEDGTERVLSKNETIEGLKIKFEGVNNIVKLHKPFNFLKKNISYFTFIGNNNFVEIRKTSTPMPVTLYIYCKEDNQSLFIDENFSCGGLTIHMQEFGSSVHIGKNCMFSAGIYCLNTDGHAIFQDGKVINRSCGIHIGDNVWVGRGVYLLKNAKIPNGCVVGAAAVIANTLNVPENSIVAGNPARLIKENIRWERTSLSEYIRKGAC